MSHSLTGTGQDTVTPVAPVKAAKPKKQPSVKKQSQPKKPTMKGGSKKLDGQSASSSSESDSSDESDLEIQEPEEVSPLPPTRPSEPEAAARYDALKAVWSPRNRHPNVDKVKSALVAFKDVVKAVRDAWKESSQAMKVAENKGDNDKAAQLKKNVVLQRRLMDVVISTTQEQGHPVIVEKYVLSLPSSLSFPHLACPRGHRSLKRIESLSHVIYLVWALAYKNVLISKGAYMLSIRGLNIPSCVSSSTRQRRIECPSSFRRAISCRHCTGAQSVFRRGVTLRSLNFASLRMPCICLLLFSCSSARLCRSLTYVFPGWVSIQWL